MYDREIHCPKCGLTITPWGRDVGAAAANSYCTCDESIEADDEETCSEIDEVIEALALEKESGKKL